MQTSETGFFIVIIVISVTPLSGNDLREPFRSGLRHALRHGPRARRSH